MVLEVSNTIKIESGIKTDPRCSCFGLRRAPGRTNYVLLCRKIVKSPLRSAISLTPRSSPPSPVKPTPPSEASYLKQLIIGSPAVLIRVLAVLPVRVGALEPKWLRDFCASHTAQIISSSDRRMSHRYSVLVSPRFRLSQADFRS